MPRPSIPARAFFVCALIASVGCSVDEPASSGTDAGGSIDEWTGAEGGARPEPERCAAPPCADGERCKDAVDCASGTCIGRTCLAATAADGIKNGGETDVDCGGPATGAVRCTEGKTCREGADCESLSCDGTCKPPTNVDGLENGSETDIDCGGGAPTNAPRCAVGASCSVDADCDRMKCTGNVCQSPTNDDGIQNGTETGVDCGGGAPTNARRCEPGEACIENGDCNQTKCTGNVCQAASGDDGIKNGSETDVDCGGAGPTNAPRCSIDKVCATHTDCASSACAISGPKANRCVPFKSCVRNEGGFTCGRNDNELGGGTVALESCCETAAVPGSTSRLNRFAITAGRMRAFIERTNGNVRAFVRAPATKPAGWQAGWDVLVPSTVAEAHVMLGQYWANAPNDPNTTDERPHSKRSCGNDNYNGHTYFVEGEAGQVYTKEALDPKVLNCVGWHLVTAFCAWDGGRLARQSELRSAFTNGGTTTYPWGYPGSQFNGAYDSEVQDSRLNHKYIYGFPGGTPASNRITWWLSPPGRFWRGWNANKIEIAGNVLEWTSDQEYNFAWNLSFENHTGTMNNGNDWRSPNDRSDVPNGYYALGARCAYP